MTQTKSGIDRRRHTRFQPKTLKIVEILNDAGKPFGEEPKLVNMSESGLAFYCSEYIPLNDRVKLSLNIAEFNSTVNAYARVVWTQRSTEHVGSHFTGVEFVGLDETDRDILRRLERACRDKK